MTSYLGRRKFLATLGGAATWPLSARAQQPSGKLPRIGSIKKFIADLGAPTDGVTNCGPALSRWHTFAKANPGAELVMEANYKFNFPNGFGPLLGCRDCTISGYGAEVVSDRSPFFGTPNMFRIDRAHSANTNEVVAGSIAITLKNPRDKYKFAIGRPVCMSGLEIQGGADGGYPPNLWLCEYRRVAAISGTRITLDEPLANTYLDTWPEAHFFTDGTYDGGPATLYALDPLWDTTQTYKGFKLTTSHPVFYGGCRTCIHQDLTWTNTTTGPAPSICQVIKFINCNVGGQNEIDKTSEYIEYNGCTGSSLLVQSTSIQQIVLDSCQFQFMTGSAKNTIIRNGCNIGSVQAGAIYGMCETLTLQNSTIGSGRPTYHGMEARHYTYANGTFKVAYANATGVANCLQTCIPGFKYIAGFYSGRTYTSPDNGPPYTFTITGLRMDADFIYVDTDNTAATLPRLTFVGNPTSHITHFFGIPFKTVTEIGMTGPSFARLTYSTEL
jgi:hypothetical protein